MELKSPTRKIVHLAVWWLVKRSSRRARSSPESASAAWVNVQLLQNLRTLVPDRDGEDSYPIATVSWVLVYSKSSDPQEAARLKDLFTWCLSDAQGEAQGVACRDQNHISKDPNMLRADMFLQM